MKILFLLLSLVCAVLLSALAALYASGRLQPAPAAAPAEEEAAAAPERHASLFPEQSRAVEELLKAILARQESMERQEALLNEREEQIGQETAVLTRMPPERLTAS